MQNRKSPEQSAGTPAHGQTSRPGQLARLTREHRASGRTKQQLLRSVSGKDPDCCDDAAFVGGDRKQSPQQPCSRSLYQTGRVRLSGGQGLDGTCRPGRRRADARWKEARSFGSLSVKNWTLDLARPVQPRGPMRRKPTDDFVILFDSERLALADPQEEPTIGGAEATDRRFVQLTCLAIGSD